MHFPHCLKKCPYCDFYSESYVSFDADALGALYQRDIAFYADKVGPRTLATLYFGGGTPSLMPIPFFSKLIQEIIPRYTLADSLEVTLEANPKTLDAEKMKAFQKYGVNRLSIGVQSLDDSALQSLGRIHTAKDALRLIEAAHKTFKTFSADFIFGRPGQTVSDLEKELKQVIALAIPHLSFYQLTLHDHYQVPLPPEDVQIEMLALVRSMLKEAGYTAYEVSNFAKFGHESRHNLAYWQSREFIGIGPSAHSRVKVDGVWHAGYNGALTPLSDKEHYMERLLMGLRSIYGVDADSFPETFLNRPKVQTYVMNGMLVVQKGKLIVTEKGISLLDKITEEIIW